MTEIKENEFKDDIEKLDSKLNKIDDDQKQAEEVYRRAKASLDKKKKENTARKRRQIAYHAVAVYRKNQFLEQEMEKLKHENKVLTTQLNDSSSNQVENDTQLSSQHELDELKRENTDLKDKVNQLIQRVNDLTKENESLKESQSNVSSVRHPHHKKNRQQKKRHAMTKRNN